MRSKMSAIGTSDSAFHDGNPSTGELGTIVTADWLNAVQASTMDLQDELLSVLAAASIANDPAVKTQILAAINKLSKLNMQSGSATFATDTGAANAYVISLTPALTARSEGQVIRLKVANTNTGASTINDGLGVVSLTGGAHSALQGGEMVAGGDAWVQWNSTVGTGSYVLLFCTGAAEQIASGSKSQHAVTLAQLNAAKGNKSGYVIFNTNQILTASAFGGVYESSGTASLTSQLPAASALPGGAITLYNGQSSGTLTASSAGGSFYGPDNPNVSSTVVLTPGMQMEFISDGTNWKAMNGAGISLLSASGYQKFPSGLIFQWGNSGSVPAGSSVTITLPLTMPVALQRVFALCETATSDTTPISSGWSAVSQSQFVLRNKSSAAAIFSWFAIGY